MQVIYRLSDNGYVKPKFPHATKQYCLENVYNHFKHTDFHILVDETNLKDETKKYVNSALWHDHVKIQFYQGGSSAASWRHAWEYMKTLPDDNILFQEDDYLYRRNSHMILLEGLDLADYVSLYDHRDKYIPAIQGGNKYVDGTGGETTKVFLTQNSHWKLTNSTTMTFAAHKSTLLQDEDVWKEYTMGTHPNDFGAFIELNKRGRSLIIPIPGYATHCEPAWAAPLIDWKNI